MTARGGMYEGPDGRMLHGDGREPERIAGQASYVEEVKQPAQPLDDSQIWGGGEKVQPQEEDQADCEGCNKPNCPACLHAEIDSLREDVETLRNHVSGLDEYSDDLEARLGAAEQRAQKAEADGELLDKYADDIEFERDRLKEQLDTSEQLRFAAEQEIDDTLDAVGATGEKRDLVLSHLVQAKVAELEGKLEASIAAYEAQRQFSQDNLAEALRRVSELEGKLPDYDPQPSIEATSKAVRALRDKL